MFEHYLKKYRDVKLPSVLLSLIPKEQYQYQRLVIKKKTIMDKLGIQWNDGRQSVGQERVKLEVIQHEMDNVLDRIDAATIALHERGIH